MTFEDAVRYLNGLIDYEKRTPGKYDAETYNLDAFRSLLNRLGDPHRGLDAIHVAGTDGKGSTCAFVESILRCAGLTTGFYCSPHLSSYTERIRLDGIPIAGEAFGRLIEEVRTALESEQENRSEPARRGFATVFEILTATAFLAFARAKVDVAIVEVGLGGRLDATNVITPNVSVITPIDCDHTRLLGTTLARIAVEKGGIIKRRLPCVLSPQSDEVMAVLEDIARQKESTLIRSEAVYAIEGLHPSAREYRFHLRGPGRSLEELGVSVVGRHQVSNARTAVVAVEKFTEPSERKLTAEQIRTGLTQTRWPGRFETLFVTGNRGRKILCVLDCAHTPQAGEALRRTLEETHPHRGFVFLVGLSADKQVPDFLRAVIRPGDIVVATRSDSPRAMDPQEVCRQARETLSALYPGTSHRVYATSQWESGLSLAARLAEESDHLLCVAGSIYLVGLVRSSADTTQTE